MPTKKIDLSKKNLLAALVAAAIAFAATLFGIQSEAVVEMLGAIGIEIPATPEEGGDQHELDEEGLDNPGIAGGD